MTPQAIAAIGVARLGLPVPMAKLVTIQAIARALNQETTAEIFAEALAECVGLIDPADALIISVLRRRWRWWCSRRRRWRPPWP